MHCAATSWFWYCINCKNIFRLPDEKNEENKVLDVSQEMKLYNLLWQYYESEHYPVNRLIPLAIIALFQLGIRPCEVCTLRYSDIVDHEISIRRFFSEKAKRIIDNRTKAGHDARTIPLTPLMEEIIEECRRCQKDLGLESEYIFLTSNNVKSFYDRMSRTLKRICRKIGLPENSPYSGRRTFVSSLIDANVNVKTVMKYCGHLSAKTTLNNYCFDRSSKEQRRKKFENARSFMSPKCCTHAVPRKYSNQNPPNR